MRGKLVRMLAEHEGIACATAIRTTLGLLDGDATATKQQRAPDVISQAIALDAARRGRPKKVPYKATRKRVQRTKTAALLATFEHHHAAAN